MNRKETTEKILQSFWQLKHQIVSRNQHIWSAVPITPSQGQVLFMIKDTDSLGVSEIAKRLNVSNSAATQLVNELVSHGYLVRKASSTDKRKHELKLTPEVQTHITKLRASSLETMAEIFTVLSEKELKEFADLIEKVSKQKEHND